MPKLRPAHVFATLAFLAVPISVASAKKCEKDWLEVKLHCAMPHDEAAKTLIVTYMKLYTYTDPDNGKARDEYTPPETHQADICFGTDNVTLGFRIKDRACDAKDISPGLYYCRLTKAEYEAAGKPANTLELCKKLNKPMHFITAYHFDANKNATEVVNFHSTNATVDPISR